VKSRPPATRRQRAAASGPAFRRRLPPSCARHTAAPARLGHAPLEVLPDDREHGRLVANKEGGTWPGAPQATSVSRYFHTAVNMTRGLGSRAVAGL